MMLIEGTGNIMRVNDRVRKHRARLHGQHCRRLDVCIGVTIENIRRIARYKGQPPWAIQQALEVELDA